MAPLDGVAAAGLRATNKLWKTRLGSKARRHRKTATHQHRHPATHQHRHPAT